MHNTALVRTQGSTRTVAKRFNVFERARPRVLLTLQWYLDNPPACLRRCVCTRALIGKAHLSARRWWQVSFICHTMIVSHLLNDKLVKNGVAYPQPSAADHVDCTEIVTASSWPYRLYRNRYCRWQRAADHTDCTEIVTAADSERSGAGLCGLQTQQPCFKLISEQYLRRLFIFFVHIIMPKGHSSYIIRD